MALRDVTLTEPDALLDSDYSDRFHAAMQDDFNTPEAFAVLFDLTRAVNKFQQMGDTENASQHAGLLKHLAELLGFLQDDPEDFLKSDLDEDMSETVNGLIEQREQARAEKDWARADEIRNQLLAMDIVLEDNEQSTQWRKKDTD